MIISGSTQVTADVILSFFFMAESYSIVYMDRIFFFHSSADEHLGGFQVLTIVNIATMNIGVNVSFKIVIFSV